MEFFKPTQKKLLIAFVLTIWPYTASLFFLLHAGERNIFSDPMDQLSFWFHSWYWSPLYPIVQHIPNVQSNPFWQSNMFLFVGYPLLRFSIRYIVACAIVFFANKLVKEHSKTGQKASASVNTTNT